MPGPDELKPQLASTLSNLRLRDVAALSRLSTAETTTTEFSQVFKENPAAALATKGIIISDDEAGRLSKTIGEMAAGPGAAAETEVTVSVTVKF